MVVWCVKERDSVNLFQLMMMWGFVSSDVGLTY